MARTITLVRKGPMDTWRPPWEFQWNDGLGRYTHVTNRGTEYRIIPSAEHGYWVGRIETRDDGLPIAVPCATAIGAHSIDFLNGTWTFR